MKAGPLQTKQSKEMRPSEEQRKGQVFDEQTAKLSLSKTKAEALSKLTKGKKKFE